MQIAQILRRSSDFEGARAEYERILKTYTDRPEATSSAGYFNAVSFIEEGDPEHGTALLEAWLFAPDDIALEDESNPPAPLTEHWQRQGYTRLAHAYRSLGKLDRAEAVFGRLGAVGTPQQRLAGRLQHWDAKLRRDKPFEVLLEVGTLLPEQPRLDSLLTGALPAPPLLEAAQHDHLHARLRFMQARAYGGLGLKEEAQATYELLIKEHPDSPEAEVTRDLIASATFRD